MRIVVQRVAHAAVAVDGATVAAIDKGFLLLVGIARTDTAAEVIKAAKKVAGLRLFADAEGRFNENLAAAGGAVLSISQFTLLGDVSGGNRPSFTAAMPGPAAEPLFDAFNFELARTHGIPVATGVFGAHMEVTLLNDGPATLVLDVGANGN